MIQLLLQFVGVAVLTLVVTLVRGRLARRRRAEVLTGGTASCRAMLSVEAGKFRRGVLLLSGTQATWRSTRGNRALDLGGARVITAGTSQERQARPDDVLLRLALPSGASLRILLHESDAATFLEVLDAPQAPAAGNHSPKPPRRPRWVLPSLAVAALWVAAWTALALDGATVTTTVTSVTADDTCMVTWTAGDGSPRSGELDCDRPVVGGKERAWALGWPVTADVEKPVDMVPGVLATGALLAAPGTISLIRRRRRLRVPVRPLSPEPPAPGTTPRVQVPQEDIPPMSADDVRQWHDEPALSYLQRLAPYATRQLAPDGWEDPGLPAGAAPAPLVRTVLRSLGVPALLVVAVLGLVWIYGGSWFVLAAAPSTATAVGTSTGEAATESHWPLPDLVTVRFRTADGIEHRADVATLEALPAGRSITVDYATTHPGEARLVGPADGLHRALVLGLGALAVLLAWAVRRGWAASAGIRAVRAATDEPTQSALALLTADPSGQPLLLACNPVVQPVELYAVPLAPPLPHGTAARFASSGGTELRLRGRLATGELVVPEIDGHPLPPSGRARPVDAEQLTGLLDSVGALVRAGHGGGTPEAPDGGPGDP